MFKLNQLIVGIFLFLSSLFSCQQKGDFQSMNVEEFDSLIQNEDIQRLDVRTLAEYSEGHIAKTININVMDDSFASMADSLLQKDKPVAVYCRSGKRSKKAAAILSEKGYIVFELRQFLVGQFTGDHTLSHAPELSVSCFCFEMERLHLCVNTVAPAAVVFHKSARRVQKL